MTDSSLAIMDGSGYGGSSSQQFTMYSYNLDDPQLFLGSSSSVNFPQTSTGFAPPDGNLGSSVIDSPGLCEMTGNLGPNQNMMPSAVDSPEYCEISSDMALDYISRMLIEEDIDVKVSMYQGEAALRATEKPFYDILGQAYPPSPNRPPLYGHDGLESPDDSSNNYHVQSCSGSTCAGAMDSIPSKDLADERWAGSYRSSVDHSSSQVPMGYSGGVGGFPGSSKAPSMSGVPDFSLPAWQFKQGVEEAKRFVPAIDKLVIDLEGDGLSISREPRKDSRLVEVKAEVESKHTIFGSRGRKNFSHGEDLDLLEGRSNKQSAVSSDDPIRNEMFDKVLLWPGQKAFDEVTHLREIMEKEASKNAQHGQNRGSARGKSRGKKQAKKEVVDLRTLLVHCAQAVATDDHRLANELLKQIRQHSSPYGDGSKRLAFCLADGLEARLAGIGSQVYHKLMAKRMSATDMLKAYRLYLAACPFKRASYYFSNQTILDVSKDASRVHIIDFGIFFGFQWPSLIERLSKREGGPPRIRITGIDVPQPGFRPSERIEETGQRLADYAKMFDVPFEYRSIASKWETICVEDLNIDKDEVLVVNCMYRIRNLGDETVAMDSPRDRVLNTIRRMNPNVFVLGIVNGSYSAPFFVTRFREVLFHYSSLFDMLDTNVPQDNEPRLLIERDLFGRDALNVIACEGSERVERPESYKQWQVRNLRAGFEQLPLNPAIVKKIKDKVREIYHKDFIVDDDNRWLLQGWKGRIIYALSSWKPNELYAHR